MLAKMWRDWAGGDVSGITTLENSLVVSEETKQTTIT